MWTMARNMLKMLMTALCAQHRGLPHPIWVVVCLYIPGIWMICHTLYCVSCLPYIAGSVFFSHVYSETYPHNSHPKWAPIEIYCQRTYLLISARQNYLKNNRNVFNILSCYAAMIQPKPEDNVSSCFHSRHQMEWFQTVIHSLKNWNKVGKYQILLSIFFFTDNGVSQRTDVSKVFPSLTDLCVELYRGCQVWDSDCQMTDTGCRRALVLNLCADDS